MSGWSLDETRKFACRVYALVARVLVLLRLAGALRGALTPALAVVDCFLVGAFLAAAFFAGALVAAAFFAGVFFSGVFLAGVFLVDFRPLVPEAAAVFLVVFLGAAFVFFSSVLARGFAAARLVLETVGAAFLGAAFLAVEALMALPAFDSVVDFFAEVDFLSPVFLVAFSVDFSGFANFTVPDIPSSMVIIPITQRKSRCSFDYTFGKGKDVLSNTSLDGSIDQRVEASTGRNLVVRKDVLLDGRTRAAFAFLESKDSI